MDYLYTRTPDDYDENETYLEWLSRVFGDDEPGQGAQLERILDENLERESGDRYCNCGEELNSGNKDRGEEVCGGCR